MTAKSLGDRPYDANLNWNRYYDRKRDFICGQENGTSSGFMSSLGQERSTPKIESERYVFCSWFKKKRHVHDFADAKAKRMKCIYIVHRTFKMWKCARTFPIFNILFDLHVIWYYSMDRGMNICLAVVWHEDALRDIVYNTSNSCLFRHYT